MSPRPKDRANNAEHVARLRRVRRGSLIVVKFGNRGGQLAEVLGDPRADGRIPVRKWRRTSRRWTLRVFVRAGEVLYVTRAPAADTLRRWGVPDPWGNLPPAEPIAEDAGVMAELRAIFGRLG